MERLDEAFVPVTTTPAKPIHLGDEAAFFAHPWVLSLEDRYARDAALARHAIRRITTDLKSVNDSYVSSQSRVRFTSIDARVKARDSFFRKLHRICRDRAPQAGLTPSTLQEFYSQIRDLCGVRFACPYYDEVLPAIDEVREYLRTLGYATDLSSVPGCGDNNYLDHGDALGYRSYHFFVRVPTVVDIYGTVELSLCEVQVRTELQHVWAVKSHNLLYKPSHGWQLSDSHVTEDMRQLSNSLRAADQALVSIRDRVNGGRRGN